MHNPFLSVIIPVYNVEEYLSICIDSILKQDFDDLEIILVNDGSIDGSGEICDEYSEKYDNISVIHKKNGGLSSARNVGIKAAKGKYICFMDSDDWWNDKASLNNIISQIDEDDDMISFYATSYSQRTHEFYDGNNYKFLNELKQQSNIEDYYKVLIKYNNLREAAYTKILKREFILNNGLFFYEGIISEDIEWMFRVLRCIRTIKTTDEKLYLYRSKREGSITNTFSLKSIYDVIKIIDLSCDFYQNNKNLHILKYEMAYVPYLWLMCLRKTISASNEETGRIMIELNKRGDVFKYSMNSLISIWGMVYKIAGVNVCLKIMKLLYKRR